MHRIKGHLGSLDLQNRCKCDEAKHVVCDDLAPCFTVIMLERQRGISLASCSATLAPRCLRKSSKLSLTLDICLFRSGAAS